MQFNDMIGHIYAFFFARPGLAQKINHIMFHLALRGFGYNNGWQLNRSGEAWFVRNVLAPEGPVFCVDVGANSGDYSRLLLQSTSACVVAYEPLPICQESLLRLASMHSGRLDVIAKAVGSEEGTLDIHYGMSEEASTLATLAPEVNELGFVGEANTLIRPVSVVTLDDELRDRSRIDFIKIDTEGYEYEVLYGAQETIYKQRPRWIQIEMNLHQLYRGHTLRQIASLLPGYKPYRLLPRGLCPVDLSRPEDEVFCYANYIFILDSA